jgi:S-methylmethionine-dependent homocysteine/selenocysteine methylase
MILQKADAFVRNGIARGTFDVIATQSSYPLVRRVISTLKEDFGLPVHFHSEEMARMLKDRSSSNVLVLDAVEVHNEFKFKIVAWEINCGSPDKMKELAAEVEQHLRQVGLEVRNQL